MSTTGNILVIDDEEILRHTLTRVLRRANYTVASAADGHEALRLLAESPYDLVYLGATDYLLKPIDPEVLLARTRVILEEQAVERRCRAIQEKIAALQEELRGLENSRSISTMVSNPTALPEDRFLKRGVFILDLQARRATFQERVITLSPAAFDYLAVLVRHAPDIVAYQTLVTELKTN